MSSDLRDRLEAALGNAYRIERELGGGGMSRVFVAIETSLGRKVVVKVLPPEMAAGVNVDRFRREIQLAASLQHPHIVPLHAAGQAGDLLYFTMPLIEGESLRSCVARGGELPVPLAIRILRDVADALAYAHQRGVVHRDIKPDNVLLSGHHALVTDFGVAKALESATGEASLTSIGIALGTPAYMAPEQAAAEPLVDHRADIYAFGCLAYEVLTGRPPFAGMTAQQVLAAHVTQRPEPLTLRRSSCPPALAALVMRCLEKKPADRPQTAAELHEQLELAATPSGGSVPTTAVVVTAPQRSPRRWLPAALASAAAAVLLGAGYLTLGRSAPDNTRRILLPAFVNRTGDAAWDPVAASATAAVSSGLAEIQGVEIVEGSDNKRSNAGTLIAGSLYRQRDSIRLSATISDAASGRTLYTVGPTVAPAAQSEIATEQIAQRIVGGVAVLLDPSWGAQGVLPSRPPRWDAFREFRDGDVAFYREDADSAYMRFARAASLDSTFALAKLRAANALVNGGPSFEKRVDSAVALIVARRASLSPFEARYLEILRTWNKGDWEGTHAAAVELTLVAPNSEFAGYLRGVFANGSRRWRESVRVLEGLDPMSTVLRNRTYYYGHLGSALHMLGDRAHELTVARKARKRFPELGTMRNQEIRALAALHSLEELDTRLSECLALPAERSWSPGEALLLASRELRAHGDKQSGERIAAQLLDWLATRGAPERNSETIRSLRVEAAQLAGRWQEALQAADSLAVEHPDDPTYHGMRGVISVHLGNRAAGGQAAGRLAAWPANRRGDTSLWRARIAAVLGESGRAVALLQDATAEGSLALALYDDDPDLESLRDVPAFRALRASKD